MSNFHSSATTETVLFLPGTGRKGDPIVDRTELIELFSTRGRIQSSEGGCLLGHFSSPDLDDVCVSPKTLISNCLCFGEMVLHVYRFGTRARSEINFFVRSPSASSTASDEHVILQSMPRVAALGLACCWCSRSAGHTSNSQALHYLFMHEEGGDKRAETHLIIYLN